MIYKQLAIDVANLYRDKMAMSGGFFTYLSIYNSSGTLLCAIQMNATPFQTYTDDTVNKLIKLQANSTTNTYVSTAGTASYAVILPGNSYPYIRVPVATSGSGLILSSLTLSSGDYLSLQNLFLTVSYDY